MKRIALFLCVVLTASLFACSAPPEKSDIVATTLPVYEFTTILCQDTGLTVLRLINEDISCLHDYSLSVDQVKTVEAADVIVRSGGELDAFAEDISNGKPTILASDGKRIPGASLGQDPNHPDPHLWMSPILAKVMAVNISNGLKKQYPDHSETFDKNLTHLLDELDALLLYGKTALQDLSCRKLITFHDGFFFFANAFDLQILESIEEDAGSEASAAELKRLITLVRQHDLPAIFVETNGSASAAELIHAETNVPVFRLDMAISGDSYFEAMYQNISTIKEALG